MIKVINGMAEKIEVFKIMFIDTMTEKIEALEKDIKRLDNINSLNAERNNKFLDHFGSLGSSVYDLNKRCDKTDDNIHDLSLSSIRTDKRCDDLVKVDNNIIECMDDLEDKNYQIKRDVDELTNNGGNNE